MIKKIIKLKDGFFITINNQSRAYLEHDCFKNHFKRKYIVYGYLCRNESCGYCGKKAPKSFLTYVKLLQLKEKL